MADHLDNVSGTAAVPSAIEQAEFRTVLGHFASGVVVVTGHGEHGPVGLTCQSFFSVSLDPPLIAFAPSAASSSWPRIEAAGTCTVNVLADSQEAVARGFARSGVDKFAGVGWSPGAEGAPRIHDSLAWLDCRIERVVEAGDHRLVLGRVTGLATGGGEPLLFYRGAFGGFRS